MKILVCLKQVPDSNARLAPDADRRWIDESGVAWVPNEFDMFAVEAALRLKDADPETEVVIATIGPDRCKQDVRKALAMGADRAVLLTDPAFQGGDPWSNSAVLAAVARAHGPFDLVFAGLQAADDNFGQTGPLLAERLGVPSATGVMSLEQHDGGVRVARELEGDARECVDLPLPAVVTFQTGAGDGPPRYPNIKGIMAAKKKEVASPTPADLDLEPASVGAEGRRLHVLELTEPVKGEGAELLQGSPEEIAQELVRRIRAKTGLL